MARGIFTRHLAHVAIHGRLCWRSVGDQASEETGLICICPGACYDIEKVPLFAVERKLYFEPSELVNKMIDDVILLEYPVTLRLLQIMLVQMCEEKELNAKFFAPSPR